MKRLVIVQRNLAPAERVHHERFTTELTQLSAVDSLCAPGNSAQVVSPISAQEKEGSWR